MMRELDPIQPEPRFLEPGDLLVLPDGSGRWRETLTYCGPGDGPYMLRVQRQSDGQLYEVDVRLVRQPRLVGAPDASTGPQGDARPPGGPSDADRITADQRRLLFALARQRGMGKEDLRAATPAGSVSKLTRAEASALIDRLRGPASPARRTPRGTVTMKQLGMMAHLVKMIGFSSEQLGAWLSKRFGVRSIDEISDKQQARKIIAGMLKVYQNAGAVRQGGPTRGVPPERSGTGAAG